MPAVFQSILPGSILPDSVASNGSRVRFTWSNQRLYLSSNDFEMDTAGFIPSGSSSPLLRPHLQPLLEDLQWDYRSACYGCDPVNFKNLVAARILQDRSQDSRFQWWKDALWFDVIQVNGFIDPYRVLNFFSTESCRIFFLSSIKISILLRMLFFVCVCISGRIWFGNCFVDYLVPFAVGVSNWIDWIKVNCVIDPVSLDLFHAVDRWQGPVEFRSIEIQWDSLGILLGFSWDSLGILLRCSRGNPIHFDHSKRIALIGVDYLCGIDEPTPQDRCRILIDLIEAPQRKDVPRRSWSGSPLCRSLSSDPDRQDRSWMIPFSPPPLHFFPSMGTGARIIHLHRSRGISHCGAPAPGSISAGGVVDSLNSWQNNLKLIPSPGARLLGRTRSSPHRSWSVRIAEGSWSVAN